LSGSLTGCLVADPEEWRDVLRDDHARLAARYGFREIQRMATLILASEIPSLSTSFCRGSPGFDIDAIVEQRHYPDRPTDRTCEISGHAAEFC